MIHSGPKILVLYAKFGDGHYQAANAIRQRFAEMGIRDVMLYDPLGEAYPAS